MSSETSFTLIEIAAAGYRSLRAIRFPLQRLSVFIGANGAGKTNLYRALQLIQAAAAGTLSRALAAEGGMEAALWTGQRQARKPARIKLMAAMRDDGATADDHAVWRYEIDIGLPGPADAAFVREPQIKEETLTLRRDGRERKLLERRGPAVFAADFDGRRVALESDLMASETVLGAIQDLPRFPQFQGLRRTVLDWRFYHDFRTDVGSPLRQPCLAVTTPTLSSDAGDLAAVFATLAHIREDTHDVDEAISDAFPGARLEVPAPIGTASLGMVFPEHPHRVFDAAELSDGTLRYLGLVGALLAYRLPAFIALNEPEASLHPALLPPLARLIARAAERTQIWVVTHSEILAAALIEHAGIRPMTVVKRAGETWIEGLRLSGSLRDEDEDD